MTFAAASALLALLMALIIGVTLAVRYSDPEVSTTTTVLAAIIMILMISLFLWSLILLLRVLIKTW